MTDKRLELLETLPEILNTFNEVREDYHHEVKHGDGNLDTLRLFRDRFNSLGAAIIPFVSGIGYLKMTRDDKACTAKKARIQKALEGTEDPHSKRTVSHSKAADLAAASDEYKEFLDDRAVYYEAYMNIKSVESWVQYYANALAGRNR